MDSEGKLKPDYLNPTATTENGSEKCEKVVHHIYGSAYDHAKWVPANNQESQYPVIRVVTRQQSKRKWTGRAGRCQRFRKNPSLIPATNWPMTRSQYKEKPLALPYSLYDL